MEQPFLLAKASTLDVGLAFNSLEEFMGRWVGEKVQFGDGRT